jgi:hypothetical protein
MFNADLALSVTMTAISTLLSVITLPANLLLYANMAYAADVAEELDWRSLFMSLAVVISAISLGLFCSWRAHSYKLNIYANKVGNLAGLALIIFSATVANTGDADSKIWSRGWKFYGACAIPCILGLLIATGLASLVNLRKPERMYVPSFFLLAFFSLYRLSKSCHITVLLKVCRCGMLLSKRWNCNFSGLGHVRWARVKSSNGCSPILWYVRSSGCRDLLYNRMEGRVVESTFRRGFVENVVHLV